MILFLKRAASSCWAAQNTSHRKSIEGVILGRSNKVTINPESPRGTNFFKLTFRSWEYHHWIALAKRMRLPPLGYDLCHGKVVGLRFPSWQPNRSGTPADLPPGWCGAREKSHVTHPLSHHAEPAVTHLGHHVTHPQSSRWRGCDPPGSSPVMTLP